MYAYMCIHMYIHKYIDVCPSTHATVIIGVPFVGVQCIVRRILYVDTEHMEQCCHLMSHRCTLAGFKVY